MKNMSRNDEFNREDITIILLARHFHLSYGQSSAHVERSTTRLAQFDELHNLTLAFVVTEQQYIKSPINLTHSTTAATRR